MSGDYEVNEGPTRDAVDADHRVDQVVSAHPEEFRDAEKVTRVTVVEEVPAERSEPVAVSVDEDPNDD